MRRNRRAEWPAGFQYLVGRVVATICWLAAGPTSLTLDGQEAKAAKDESDEKREQRGSAAVGGPTPDAG